MSSERQEGEVSGKGARTVDGREKWTEECIWNSCKIMLLSLTLKVLFIIPSILFAILTALIH